MPVTSAPSAETCRKHCWICRSISVFPKVLFSWVGFETEYIPYVAAERFAGTTKWSFAKLIKYAMEGVISFSTMPLQLATFCGALVSVFAIVYGIIIIAHTLLTGIDVPGLCDNHCCGVISWRYTAAGYGDFGRISRQNLYPGKASSGVCREKGAGEKGVILWNRRKKIYLTA